MAQLESNMTSHMEQATVSQAQAVIKGPATIGQLVNALNDFIESSSEFDVIVKQMNASVDVIDGHVIEISSTVIGDNNPFVVSMEIMLQDVASFVDSDIDVKKYIFAPYDFTTNSDGLRVFHYGKLAVLS